MKEDASYDLRRSLDEIGTARANRKADVGVDEVLSWVRNMVENSATKR
jgi:hypothetical protein